MIECKCNSCICPCHDGLERCWCKYDCSIPHGKLPITDEQTPKKRWDMFAKKGLSYKDRVIDI